MKLQKDDSRRRFLASAAMTVGAGMMPRLGWAAASISPDSIDLDRIDPGVAGIVATSIGVDTHNHIDVPLTAAEMPGPEIDLTGEMKRSGLAAICMTFATDYQTGGAYGRFQNGLAAMDRQLLRNGIERSLNAADVRAAHAKRRPTVIQAVEGAHFLEGHVERVEESYRRGLRHLGLLHDSDASTPLGDVYTNPPRFGGLTAFGSAVIRECNRLGILVDLAHANVQTTEMALRVSTRPVIVSHTGLDTQLGTNPRTAEMMRPRLIGKEQAKMVANAGGIIGVWTHLAETPLDYAHNLRALVDVVGVEHVCLGTDTKLTQPGGAPHPPRIGERTDLAWAGQTAGFYYVVVDAMLKTGFTPDEIGRIGGGNFLRVFGAATAN